MSQLYYNGIVLEMVRTNEFKFEPIYSRDRIDILYTKVSLNVTCVFNPEATTYTQDIPPDTIPEPPVEPLPEDRPVPPFAKVKQFKGMEPGHTLNTVRRLLTMNRGKLQLVYGNHMVIDSPKDTELGHFGAVGDRDVKFADCDANGGPEVQFVLIQPLGETRTWLVQFSVVTWVDDCYAFGNQVSPNPLISNRWQQTAKIDDRFYTTIYTQGIAVFRLDSLSIMARAELKEPDGFRSAILPFIHPGFRRVSCDITVLSNHNAMAYECVDVQMPYSLGTKASDFYTPAKYGVVRFEGSTTIGTMTMQSDTGLSIAGPLNQGTIDIAVWGDAKSRRYNLLHWAILVAVERFHITPIPPLVNGVDDSDGTVVRGVSVKQMMHDQMVMLHMDVWFKLGKDDGQPRMFGLGQLWNKFLDVEGLEESFPDDANQSFPGGLHPNLPNDYGTRGTWAGYVISQVVGFQCDIDSSDPRRWLCPPSSDAVIIDDSKYQNLRYADCKFTIDYNRNIPYIQHQPNKFNPATVNKTIWTDYKSTKAYRTNYHRTYSPVMKTKKPLPAPAVGGTYHNVEIMTISNPATELVVEWTAESVGRIPYPPAPCPPNEEWTLLDSYVAPHCVVLAENAESRVHRLSGKYVYVTQKPFDLDSGRVTFGIAPWVGIPHNQTALERTHFNDTVIFEGAGTGGGKLPPSGDEDEGGDGGPPDGDEGGGDEGGGVGGTF